MIEWYVVLGFIAQSLFALRQMIQWFLSEKAKMSVSPLVYWQLSLLASILFTIYGWYRFDFSIMMGQWITYYIYIFNLKLMGYWEKIPAVFKFVIVIFPLLLVSWTIFNNHFNWNQFFKNDHLPVFWLILGVVGQVIFTLRFVIQWRVSKNQNASVFPISFWVISIIGSGLILIYGLYRWDFVLLFGHGLGLVIYIRNFMIMRQNLINP